MKRGEGEEEEEEEKKKRRGGVQEGFKGMELLTLSMETEFMYGFYEIMYEFPCFDGDNLAQI